MKRLVAYLCTLQALDVLTTIHGLSAGAQEQNPIGQAVLAAGWLGLAAAKALGTLVIIALAWVLWRGSHPANQGQALLGLRIACSFMVAVVGWNSWIILLRH